MQNANPPPPQEPNKGDGYNKRFPTLSFSVQNKGTKREEKEKYLHAPAVPQTTSNNPSQPLLQTASNNPSQPLPQTAGNNPSQPLPQTAGNDPSQTFPQTAGNDPSPGPSSILPEISTSESEESGLQPDQDPQSPAQITGKNPSPQPSSTTEIKGPSTPLLLSAQGNSAAGGRQQQYEAPINVVEGHHEELYPVISSTPPRTVDEENSPSESEPFSYFSTWPQSYFSQSRNHSAVGQRQQQYQEDTFPRQLSQTTVANNNNQSLSDSNQPPNRVQENNFSRTAAAVPTNELNINQEPPENHVAAWITGAPAKIYSASELLESKKIQKIKGKLQCENCGESEERELQLGNALNDLSDFIVENEPQIFTFQVGRRFRCSYCGQMQSVKPVMDHENDDGKNIDWLFLLVGRFLECCDVEQLEKFCKDREINLPPSGVSDRPQILHFHVLRDLYIQFRGDRARSILDSALNNIHAHHY